MLQTPKSTVEIKELKVDISKDGGSRSNLFVRLHILPILFHIGEPRASCDQFSNFSGGGCSSSAQASIASIEKSPAPFVCEKVSISCEFGHDRYFIFVPMYFHLFELWLEERFFHCSSSYWAKDLRESGLCWEDDPNLPFVNLIARIFKQIASTIEAVKWNFLLNYLK